MLIDPTPGVNAPSAARSAFSARQSWASTLRNAAIFVRQNAEAWPETAAVGLFCSGGLYARQPLTLIFRAVRRTDANLKPKSGGHEARRYKGSAPRGVDCVAAARRFSSRGQPLIVNLTLRSADRCPNPFQTSERVRPLQGQPPNRRQNRSCGLEVFLRSLHFVA